jgi:aldehyde decarbonylase
MQKQELNSHCEFYIRRFPRLKIKVVDGSSLAAAIVLNNIPKGTNEVLFRGKFNKVAVAIVNALCRKNIKVCLCAICVF